MTTDCEHPNTFQIHGGVRCSNCFTDAIAPAGGSLIWPSNDRPDLWDAKRISDWFLDHRIYALSQGCEGFEFCRNNYIGSPHSPTYGYIWVELTLDLDYEMAWLLDVRKHNGVEETRDFLFVATGAFDARIEPRFMNTPTNFSNDNIHRSTTGIRWFADQVDLWLNLSPNTKENN